MLNPPTIQFDAKSPNNILWLPMRESVGNILYDISGGGRDGTYIGTGWDSVDDIGGPGLFYDGIDDTLTVPNDVTLQTLGATGQSFTCELCVLFGNIPAAGQNHFFAKWGGVANYTFSFVQTSVAEPEEEAGSVEFRIWDGVNASVASSNGVVSPYKWHYLCGVRDTSTATLRMYVDGVLHREVADLCDDCSNTGDIVIGYVINHFSGWTYFCRIHNKVLTSNEISNVYASLRVDKGTAYISQ